jgi:hypothetical protein
MVVSVLVLSVPVPARATQNITVTDDSPIPIVISSYQLTLIKLPATVVPNGLMTVNPAFEIRGNGRNIAIDPKNTTAPGDLVVMTENESYIFQVTPKPIPAEMIVVEDIRQAAGGGKPEADVVRRSDSYPEANVELIRQAAQGTLPRSCILRDVSKKAYPKWLELDVLNVREYRCPQYTVRLYDLYNSKKETQSLRQTEFFTGQELSIALDRSVIANGQSAVVFIVTYTEPLPKEGQGRKGQSPDPDAWRNN